MLVGLLCQVLWARLITYLCAAPPRTWPHKRSNTQWNFYHNNPPQQENRIIIEISYVDAADWLVLLSFNKTHLWRTNSSIQCVEAPRGTNSKAEPYSTHPRPKVVYSRSQHACLLFLLLNGVLRLDLEDLIDLDGRSSTFLTWSLGLGPGSLGLLFLS